MVMGSRSGMAGSENVTSEVLGPGIGASVLGIGSFLMSSACA